MTEKTATIHIPYDGTGLSVDINDEHYMYPIQKGWIEQHDDPKVSNILFQFLIASARYYESNTSQDAFYSLPSTSTIDDIVEKYQGLLAGRSTQENPATYIVYQDPTYGDLQPIIASDILDVPSRDNKKVEYVVLKAGLYHVYKKGTSFLVKQVSDRAGQQTKPVYMCVEWTLFYLDENRIRQIRKAKRASAFPWSLKPFDVKQNYRAARTTRGSLEYYKKNTEILRRFLAQNSYNFTSEALEQAVRCIYLVAKYAFSYCRLEDIQIEPIKTGIEIHLECIHVIITLRNNMRYATGKAGFCLSGREIGLAELITWAGIAKYVMGVSGNVPMLSDVAITYSQP